MNSNIQKIEYDTWDHNAIFITDTSWIDGWVSCGTVFQSFAGIPG